jgi:two-component system response regulator (stage 0 sporulation protein F)
MGGNMNRILVLDDDEAIRMLYADELYEEGYEVIASGDVLQVIQLIEQKRPDLIVMDIRLGKFNGLDLLQDIRNAYYDIPVILCTAYPAFQYDMKSIAADYFVIKSSNLTELKAKIKTAIETGPLPLSGAGHNESYYPKTIQRD